MDLSYKDYIARQFRELEQDRLLERALALRPSGNYKRVGASVLPANANAQRLAANDGPSARQPCGLPDGAGWVPLSYPGFAIISMVDENQDNHGLPGILKAIQADLLEQCPWEESIYPLPSGSFHQTIANNLSEDRFLQHIHRPGLEPVYPDLVARAFTRLPSLPHRALPMRLIGVSIFGTALGALGIFDSEPAYQRILDFRAGFYDDPHLSTLDIRMTRPFIGHITLAYIETDLDTTQREMLATAVYDINKQFEEAMPAFNLSLTGLRRYHHLSAFHREEDYPRYHL